MKHPPMVLYVKIHGGGKRFCLWLPLFLLLPLALVLLVALSPLILLVVLILWLSGRGKRALTRTRIAFRLLGSIRFIRAAFDLLCSTCGLRIDISSHNDRVRIFVA